MAISRMRRYAKVIAFLTICTVGISGCGRERGAAELPFFGTWYIEKVAVIYMIPKILSDMSWSILQIISG